MSLLNFIKKNRNLSEIELLRASIRLMVLQKLSAGKDLVSGLRKMGKYGEISKCELESALLITNG
jgi:hypothetical protein